MATRDAASVAGAYARTPLSLVRGASAIDGGSCATVRPAWSGQSQLRKVIDWLPKIGEPVVTPTGQMSQRWYAFFREIASRLGGIDASSLGEVINSLQATQAQLQSTVDYAVSVGQFASTVQAQTTAVVSAAAAAGVPTTSVPPAVDPPTYSLPAYKQDQINRV